MPKAVAVGTQQQEKVIDFIRDWCKWLIGLSFTSGTGCITILQQGVAASIKVYLAAAILFFALTSLVSIIMIAVLPVILQHLPLVTKSGGARSIYDYKIFSTSVSVKSLAILQLLFFLTGLVFLFLWILLKPAG